MRDRQREREREKLLGAALDGPRLPFTWTRWSSGGARVVRSVSDRTLTRTGLSPTV